MINYNRTSRCHVNILLHNLPQILQQITTLEIRVGMDNRIKIRLAPTPLVPHFFELRFMCPFKHPITSNVIASFPHVLPHPSQNFLIVNTCRLE
ncbi:hypothetical protein I7I50_02613 [Histoplasma capsulatum G186AR]|uniref:Uncharacterized protein n=1 Tax=Ajellomyces capsulatus TaxID=5037 RepID=A0A8H7Z2A3_AJECA|nr:hypothetical protein I7I52_00724 [Histoplasma capsulatum]QSS71680.1 hypothetical protein I7I50_02613 [Histoplasma capsulatum G186AR]